MLLMFSEGLREGPGCRQDVLEDAIDQCLEHSRSISQTKGHNQVHELTQGSFKSHLLSLSFTGAD